MLDPRQSRPSPGSDSRSESGSGSATTCPGRLPSGVMKDTMKIHENIRTRKSNLPLPSPLPNAAPSATHAARGAPSPKQREKERARARARERAIAGSRRWPSRTARGPLQLLELAVDSTACRVPHRSPRTRARAGGPLGRRGDSDNGPDNIDSDNGSDSVDSDNDTDIIKSDNDSDSIDSDVIGADSIDSDSMCACMAPLRERRNS